MILNNSFDFSLDKSNIEVQLLDQLISEKIYRVTLSDFAKRLQIPEKNIATVKLFNLFSKPSPQIMQDDLIDLRDYLLCALFLLTLDKPKIQLVELLFKVSFKQILMNYDIFTNLNCFY